MKAIGDRESGDRPLIQRKRGRGRGVDVGTMSVIYVLLSVVIGVRIKGDQLGFLRETEGDG